MKSKKAAGHDGIMAEHLKLGGPQLYVHLCLLFNSMIRHSYVPDAFGHGIIIPLLKDKHGDSSKLEMYRGITLSPAITKLFELVLVDLYEDQLATHDLQYGFKKQHGCSHALFTFKETTKYFISKGSKVYCAFLDASKAFDKVLHNGLFLKLLERNVSVDFVRLLRNWYCRLTASVMWNNFVGAHFVILCGVRQGGVLSSLLFSVYVDDLIQLLKHSGYGTYIGSQFVGTILYADDITLLSGSCRGLQKMLDICAEFGHKWDICFNAKKSHILTLGGNNPVNCRLFLDSRPIEWTSKVKYLGIHILAGAVQKVDITDAKRKYYGCFNSILSVCGKRRNELASLHLVKSYCLPRLLYGCESMLLSTLQIRELDIIWNNAFRYIFNCCWRESVKPLQFYCNTVPLSYMIEERKLLFYRKISLSKNVVLRTLMCLPSVSSDYMFLCSKYSVRPTSTRGHITDAVSHAFMESLGAYL